MTTTRVILFYLFRRRIVTRTFITTDNIDIVLFEAFVLFIRQGTAGGVLQLPTGLLLVFHATILEPRENSEGENERPSSCNEPCFDLDTRRMHGEEGEVNVSIVYLCFGEIQCVGQFDAFRCAEILLSVESFLKSVELMITEHCSRLTSTAMLE